MTIIDKHVKSFENKEFKVAKLFKKVNPVLSKIANSLRPLEQYRRGADVNLTVKQINDFYRKQGSDIRVIKEGKTMSYDYFGVFAKYQVSSGTDFKRERKGFYHLLQAAFKTYGVLGLKQFLVEYEGDLNRLRLLFSGEFYHLKSYQRYHEDSTIENLLLAMEDETQYFEMNLIQTIYNV